MILATPQASCKIHFEHWPVVWLWPVSLVFMQLTLMDLDGFQLTLSVVICHAMQLTIVMLYWLGRPSDHQVVLALAVILYTLLLGLFAQDGVEFARSLAHILNLLVRVVICFNARLGQAHELRRSLAVFCLVATGAGEDDVRRVRGRESSVWRCSFWPTCLCRATTARASASSRKSWTCTTRAATSTRCST
jgi:hypothetical protein